jgi:hypothetical protein
VAVSDQNYLSRCETRADSGIRRLKLHLEIAIARFFFVYSLAV